MEQVMQAYSKNREVSAQEAVVRTCSLKLKSSSQAVIFIPTDDSAVRMSLPMKCLQDKDPDDENVWMTGLAEKYMARPNTPEFENMCMAEFASEYRIVYAGQRKGENTFDEPHRRTALSPSRYFNARLFSADNRFARDTNYIFFAQFVTEMHLATSSMSIQLRKAKSMTRDGCRINSALLQDKQELDKLTVGNSHLLLDIQCCRDEMARVIKAQQGETVDFSALDWSEKCEILRSNPVTAMRMFEKRVEDAPEFENDMDQDDSAVRMSLPMKCLQDKDPDDENVWMTGLAEKYMARPNTPEFENMCMAEFASEYRIVYAGQRKGENTFDEPHRRTALSPSRYFNARLFSADNRFARDTNYIFFAQFVTEMHLATSSMSIQLRKAKSMTRDGCRINSALLQDKQELDKLVRNNEGSRFMQPLRGTPAYWEKTLRDLFAMLRQLGTPTFFCTFSAAEMRWPEVSTVIKAQQGETVDFSALDWSEKCEILRSNPVTAMRMFEKRVEDAPEFENDMDQGVCDFIDRYISCKLPDPNTK
ncbi:hypothetical protein SRHO_G00342550 [Serrasalmus rhombeus]